MELLSRSTTVSSPLKPADLITIHTLAAIITLDALSGAYDSVADPLFGKEHVDAYYLEYDDARPEASSRSQR